MPEALFDAAGRPRSPVTVPGYHTGRSPRNKGPRYPADPPTVTEIVAVMRHAGTGVYGARLRALIVVLWRAGLRIHEALALREADLDPRRGSVLVRRGKGGRRREVGMDDWAWEQLQPWLTARLVARPLADTDFRARGPSLGGKVALTTTSAPTGRCRRAAPAPGRRAGRTPARARD